MSVLVWMTEGDLGQRRTAAGIVNNLLYDSPNVSMPLSIVRSAKFGGRLVEAGVGGCDQFISDLSTRYRAIMLELTENGATPFPLVADHTTHGVCLNEFCILVLK
jgi:hypothetical protein